MACASCAEKARLGLAGFIKGILYGPADPNLQKQRMELCQQCPVADTSGARLFREIDGVHYCGAPRLSDLRKVWRDEFHEGCGCKLEYKTSRQEAACPRGHWDAAQTNDTAAEAAPVPEKRVVTPSDKPEHIVAAAAALSCYMGRVAWSVPQAALPLAQLFPVADMLLPLEAQPAAPDATVLSSPDSKQTLPERFGALLGVQPCMPELSLPAEALSFAAEAHGFDRKKTAILAPMMPGTQHAWPLRRWLELEEALMAAGVGTVVLDPDENGAHTRHFRSVRHFSVSVADMAALVQRAALVIGGDSRALLLAGVQRIPALALCGPLDGVQAFGWFGIISLKSWSVPCAPCGYRKAAGYTRFCSISCEAMLALPLDEVKSKAFEMLS